MIKKTIQILFMIGLMPILHAQENKTLVISVQQAREYALKHNKVLQNAKTDVEISKKQIWETIAQGLPQVDGTVDYTDFFNYEVEFNVGGSGEDVYQPNPLLLDAGDFEILKLLQGMSGSGSNTIKMNNSSTATLQISQLIFSGQYWVGMQVSKIASAIAQNSYQNTENDVVEGIVSSYYMALVTEETKKILDLNIKNLQSTLEKTEVMLAAGMAEEVDVDQLRLAVMMIESSKTQLNRAIQLSYNLIRFQMGAESNTEIVLSDNLESLILQINVDVPLGQIFNVSDNLTYRLMSQQEEISKKMLQMEKWTFAPTLVGFYSYKKKLLTTDFDMNPNHIAGVSLSVPIFSSGMRYSKVQQKKLELIKTQNMKSLLEDQLLMQEKQFRFDLINSIEQYEIQKKSITVAQKVYKSIELKFSQGMASSLDLTQASDNFLKSQNSYIQSLMSLLQAKLNYDKLINKL
ncbi:MAG: TolC family protein [Bacteroidales bacterium]|nr:TolC family protein [Bacteroidales bacterium]